MFGRGWSAPHVRPIGGQEHNSWCRKFLKLGPKETTHKGERLAQDASVVHETLEAVLADNTSGQERVFPQTKLTLK